MHRLWQLGTRNWSSSPGRTLAAVLSVALGVATVVIITSFYETARRAIRDQVVRRWLGAAHLSIHPPGAHWGTLEASLAETVAGLDNVRDTTARLRRRARLIRHEGAGQMLDTRGRRVDAVGIDPETEAPFLSVPHLTGRMIGPDERGVAVMERETAAAWDTELGGTIVLSAYRGGPTIELTVVGLFDSQRIAEFQRPNVYVALADVQEFKNEPGAASAIDLMLEDTSPEALARTQAAVERLLVDGGFHQHKVVSAAARQMVLDEAEQITRVLLMMTASVALLTSFFIILTTVSMSLFERRRLLGAMRCVGLTRLQLVWLLFVELIPLGLIGTALGILAGIGVTKMSVSWIPDGHVPVHLSTWGIGLAAASGILTTVVSTLILLLQVCRVTPLAAVNPDTHAPQLRYLYLAGVLGVVLLAVHEGIVGAADQTRWLNVVFAWCGAGSLYLGYILVAPALVILLGPPIARFVGPMLGVRKELAEDQFGRAPWRSTGVCWVLMVGLSLIVYIGTGSEAVLGVWNFPGRLPEAFVWSPQYVSGESVAKVRQLPGVRDLTVITDVDCEIATPDVAPPSATDALMKRLVRRFTRPVFVAADPERVFNIFKVAFIEGTLAEAKAKLARGGAVLIPVHTSRSKGLHLGDRVTVTAKGRSADFEIAGVVQSPALDLAVTAFQAESYMQFAAASAMLGTQRDLAEKFDLDAASMFLCNLDLPKTPPPPGFDRGALRDFGNERSVAKALLEWRDYLPNERDLLAEIGPQLEDWYERNDGSPAPQAVAAPLQRFGKAGQRADRRWNRGAREQSWLMFRERLILLKIGQTIDRPEAIMGSVRRLKQQVDRSIRQAIVVLTWLPSLLLPVAAIGIGNLMMVSVQIRARQIAILRAVGAFQSQIIRLVLAEAIVLGLLGSVVGIALGLHEAYSDNRVSAGLVGFYMEFIIPLGTVALGVILTVGTCLVAGFIPARYAARSNVIDAMQAS